MQIDFNECPLTTGGARHVTVECKQVVACLLLAIDEHFSVGKQSREVVIHGRACLK